MIRVRLDLEDFRVYDDAGKLWNVYLPGTVKIGIEVTVVKTWRRDDTVTGDYTTADLGIYYVSLRNSNKAR